MDSVPIKFVGNGEIEAGEAKQYAEKIPTCHDLEKNSQFAEGEYDAESVTTISSEIQQPHFMEDDLDAEDIPTICHDTQENFHFAEGEHDAEPDFKEANQDAENICREVQNRTEENDFTGTEKGADEEGDSERDKIMAWMEKVTNEIAKVRVVR
ncbi:hypothetical protein FOVG_17887 [Fusarium oxysporum f. sp. pisi HDV247]|uniref:Uncharacterized protein n=1 Tax=Fusarium oxysporum f. sp. pisi HDV247 TaxID=1080344 RepID=W9NJ77_FUSOX|nr:hypothetical protein FOVG_17887 [Fusarium oxysporum f. sp. pisi HDV247]